MKLLLLTCLLLYGSIPTAQAGLFNQSKPEGEGVSLVCSNEGKVVWSKGADGGRSDILTAEGGVITQKHRADPGNRYRVLPTDLSLAIVNLSLSDSGIYYCNSVPVVYLTVYPAPPAAERSPTTSPAVYCCSSVSSSETDNDEEEENSDSDESSEDSSKETSPTPTPPAPTNSSEASTKEPSPTPTPPTPTDSSDTSTKETPPTPTPPTPTNPSEDSTKEPPPTPSAPKYVIIALGVLAGVVLIILALPLHRCYFRRKAIKARAADHVYETIKDTSPTTSPTTHPASAAPKEYEAVYVLAGDPDIIKLGLKDQSAASPLAAQSTETTPSEALYSTIQAVDV